MNFTEKDLEDMIWDAAGSESGRDLLKNRGLDIRGTMFRQLGLGAYGVADLVEIAFNPKKTPGGWRECYIDIYELKKGDVDIDTLIQALRYKEGITHFLTADNLKLYPYFQLHLIGWDIDFKRDFLSVIKSLNSDMEVLLYQYRVDYNGLHFNPSDASKYVRSSHGNLSKRISKHALRAVFNRTLRYGSEEGE